MSVGSDAREPLSEQMTTTTDAPAKPRRSRGKQAASDVEQPVAAAVTAAAARVRALDDIEEPDAEALEDEVLDLTELDEEDDWPTESGDRAPTVDPVRDYLRQIG